MFLADITSEYRGKLIIHSYKKHLKKGYKVLDVGCGNGVVSDQLRNHFNLKIHGCDVINYLIRDIPFTKTSTSGKLPFKSKSFDRAMFNDVLHHMPKKIQEKLILESLRTANEVLIFEVQPTLVGKFFDYILNKMHNSKMNIPFTFRSISEWTVLFDKLKINYKIIYVKQPPFYPFAHVAFVLQKNK